MRDGPRRALAASLVVGAVFDLVFALGILYTPELAARLLRLPLPREMIYLRLTAILLVILAMFYLVSASALERVPALAAVAAAGRLLGCLFFVRVWMGGAPFAFLTFAVADALLAGAHGGFLLWGTARAGKDILR